MRMNKIRYLTMVVMCLIWHITAYGQGDFNPTSPSEPGTPQLRHTLTLVAVPSDGGTVSGGGSIVDGTTRTLTATAKSEYQFVAWADKDGMVLSTSRSFSYTTKDVNETLYAHFRFSPGSPSEPAEPKTTLYYKLTVQGSQGCTVSGGGRYLYGKSIRVSASVESGYQFVNWTNEDGEVVSTSSSFNYNKKDANETLTAHCVFNPASPDGPGDPILKHWVKATCTDGGTISGNVNERLLEGKSYTLRASTNTGYRFLGWYKDGELYTALSSFSAVMGKENVILEARFVFDPTSPSEPLMPAISTYSYYLPTVNSIPDNTISYAIYLANEQIVRDMNIRLTFPAEMDIDPNDFVLSVKAEGYTVTISEAQDDISIIEEGAKLWDFTLIGGVTHPATQALLTFKVKIPEDMPTGTSKQVKINQISMVQEDGTAVTAHTRNGRIGVYKLGDSNGDDSVDLQDKQNLIKNILEMDTPTFIQEVSDINDDGTIDLQDTQGLIKLIIE